MPAATHTKETVIAAAATETVLTITPDPTDRNLALHFSNTGANAVTACTIEIKVTDESAWTAWLSGTDFEEGTLQAAIEFQEGAGTTGGRPHDLGSSETTVTLLNLPAVSKLRVRMTSTSGTTIEGRGNTR